MKSRKEILIQDVGEEQEIELYEKYNIYRRDVVYGTPLYFIPYFTRKSNEIHGASEISRILGIITCKEIELAAFGEELENFCAEKEEADKEKLLKRWGKGIGRISKNGLQKDATFFFLDDPVRLPIILHKDGGKEKGRGKNWVAAMISKNRCITFQDLIERINYEYNIQK